LQPYKTKWIAKGGKEALLQLKTKDLMLKLRTLLPLCLLFLFHGTNPCINYPKVDMAQGLSVESKSFES
jgi:hypothetical protein